MNKTGSKHENYKQLVSTASSNASELARICLVNDGLAGPCTDDVGVANFRRLVHGRSVLWDEAVDTSCL